LVEIATGCLAAACWLYAPDWLNMADVFVFCALLLAIGLIDLDTWLIPVPLLVILIVVGLGFGFLHGETELLERLIGFLLGFGVLALFLLISSWILRRLRRLGPDEYAMGWGDPVLLGGIGAGLGWLSLSFVVTLASVQAVLLYGFFSWARKPLPDDKWVPPDRSMPFGPFLALAGVELSLYYLLY
jgi:leader peptidase (prepilin peptidase)/N-methyltransferase